MWPFWLDFKLPTNSPNHNNGFKSPDSPEESITFLEEAMKLVQYVGVLVFVSLIALSQAGLYGKDTKVITTLNKNNFRDLVIQSNELWVLEFYANWCGHCKNFAPHMEKVAESLNGLVKVAAIDVDEEKELAGLFKVEGIPSIRIIRPRSVPDQNGAWTPEALDYKGARTASDLVKFALEALPNEVNNLKAATVDQFLAANEKRPKVVLFTNKPKTSDLYKSLASRYLGAIDFSQVQNTEKALVEKYSVESFPTLFLFPVGQNGAVDAASPVKYEGALKSAAIDEFLAPHVPKAKSSSSSSSKPAKPVEELKPEVIAVTSDQILAEKCTNKLGLCFLAFLDPQDEDHAANLERLQKVADKHYKSFKIFWVDGRAQNNLRETLGVSDMLPGAAVYSPGRGTFITHRGSFALESVSEFFDDVLKGNIRRSSKLDKLPPLEVVKDEL